MKRIALALAILGYSLSATANSGDYLIKLAPEMKAAMLMQLQTASPKGTQVEDLRVADWVHVKVPQATHLLIDRFKS